MHPMTSVLASVASLLALAAPLAAQCETQWLPGPALAGIDGPARALTMWDPDGSGPAAAQLVIAGSFSVAGNLVANRICLYDPVTRLWTPLGSGIAGTVVCLTVLANGDLVAGGAFATAGGVTVNNVARWNGSSWSAFGSGIAGGVWALHALPNGDLVAGGAFATAGGVAAANVARWNGSSWLPLGTGTNAQVFGLTTTGTGDLVAGGDFSSAGGVAVNYVARWDGAGWAAMGGGMAGYVSIVTRLGNGDPIAVSGGNLARWNGSSWMPILGTSSWIACAVPTPGGGLLAGAANILGTAPSTNIAEWNGASWSPVGGATSTPLAMAVLPDGSYVAAASTGRALGICRRIGTVWSPLHDGWMGANSRVFARSPSGELMAGGSYLLGDGTTTSLMRWNGSQWTPVATPPNWNIYAMTWHPNGDLIVGGYLYYPFANVARWDGTTWHAMGQGMNNFLYALTTLPNGDVLAGGDFSLADGQPARGLARWNGSGWSGVGGTGSWPKVYSLHPRPSGDVLVGGTFTSIGGVAANHIARWDGGTFFPLGAGVNSAISACEVRSITSLPTGDIVAAGMFQTAGGVTTNNVARWNGSNWSALGAGVDVWGAIPVNATLSLPDGGLLVAGDLNSAGGAPASRIARWDGSHWHPVAAGANYTIHALDWTSGGEVVVGGLFRRAGNAAAVGLARLQSSCPAVAAAFGSGCVGTGGANVLVARSLPWVGSTYTAVATGLPANALAIGLRGLSMTSIPLGSLLPQGVAGCNLLTTLEGTDLYVPTAGRVETTFAIPNLPVLAGLSVHQQVVAIELDGAGNILAVTSTNALRATIGVF